MGMPGSARMAPERRRLASAEEVAEYLGVPLQTIYTWRSRNKGPRGRKVGRHLRFRWSDVEQWFDEQAA